MSLTSLLRGGAWLVHFMVGKPDGTVSCYEAPLRHNKHLRKFCSDKPQRSQPTSATSRKERLHCT